MHVPVARNSFVSSCTNSNESQAVKTASSWRWTWHTSQALPCPSDRFHTSCILVLYHSCHRFSYTERAEKHEQTVTLGLTDISTFNYSSVNRLKITSAAISNGSGRSLAQELLAPACSSSLQNIIAFHLTSFVPTLPSVRGEIRIIYTPA